MRVLAQYPMSVNGKRVKNKYVSIYNDKSQKLYSGIDGDSETSNFFNDKKQINMKVITPYPIYVNPKSYSGFDNDEFSSFNWKFWKKKEAPRTPNSVVPATNSSNPFLPTPTGKAVDPLTITPLLPVDPTTGKPIQNADKIDSMLEKGLTFAQIVSEFKKAGKTPPTQGQVKVVADNKKRLSTGSKALIIGGILLAVFGVMYMINKNPK